MECECIQIERYPIGENSISSNEGVWSQGRLSSAHLRELELREQNQRDLQSLQQVILMEEDRVMNTEEVMARVLNFYNRFVPWKSQPKHSRTR